MKLVYSGKKHLVINPDGTVTEAQASATCVLFQKTNPVGTGTRAMIMRVRVCRGRV